MQMVHALPPGPVVSLLTLDWAIRWVRQGRRDNIDLIMVRWV